MRQWINLFENEILDEINLIKDFDDDINANRLKRRSLAGMNNYKFFNSSKKLGKIGDLTLSSYQEEGREIFFLSSKTTLLGKASVQMLGSNIGRITHIWFDSSIRGKGIGYTFYVFLLNHGYKLVTDYSQTRSSKRVWERLAAAGYVYLYEHNTATKQVRDIDKYYGEENYSLLIAQK